MDVINLYKGYHKVLDMNDSKVKKQTVWFNYMNKYSNVRQMCIDDYLDEGLDWKEFSISKVFGYDQDYVDRMNKTSDLLEQILLEMKSKLLSFYKYKQDNIIIVIYHGLGNAAGWVSTYEGKNAIYLGVEKIVELGWDTKSKLEDLVSHEYGHLVHMDVRNESLEPFTNYRQKMIYRLYTEGVATYCESLFNGREISSPTWYEDATLKEELLKEEFVSRLDKESSDIIDFFGDWHPVLGLIEAGYYLGLKVIEALVKRYSLLDVMSLDYKDVEEAVLYSLHNKKS